MDLHTVTLGALLHDIGKPVRRGSGERRTHSVIGADFIQAAMEKTEAGTEQLSSPEGKALLHCIRYHHAAALSGAKLQPDDPAYIVYEADNIAAGLDRREKAEEGEDSTGGRKFDSRSCLENIFNCFGGTEGKKTYFSLKPLIAERFVNYPGSRPGAKTAATPGAYAGLVETLRNRFSEKSPLSMSADELLRILEDTLVYVPSSTNTEEICDISLYDHLKMTGAVAAAMLRYFSANGITDFKKACFSPETEIFREKKMFLLVSGDFSGIQKFIYRIPNRGAMRMLRGRSFYLEIALENMIDTLLETLGLSRANLIYSGGGHFYLLTDNTEETRRTLEAGFEEINRELLTRFGTSLYLAGGWTEVSAAELMGREGSVSGLFRRVSAEISEKKQKRYDPALRAELFREGSQYNAAAKEERECFICHTSAETLEPYAAGQAEDDGTETAEACPLCNGLYLLGKAIVDEEKLFAVLSEIRPEAVPLTSPLGEMWLAAVTEKEAAELAKKGILRHLYDKNRNNTSAFIKTRLWTADYAAKNGNHVLDFAELAEESGEGEKGIRRLGVLRADVDWLGAAFMAGIPKRFATLSRYAALSRSLAMFFKFLLMEIARKNLPDGMKPFYLFTEKEGEERRIHVVYSGGDDLFLVGAWDDLLEMAVDLRRAFAVYTNGKLSFSAGLGLFNPGYPVSRMAELTGGLEDEAKDAEGKDHIALWGESTEMDENGEKRIPRFSWDELTGEIKGKLDFLTARLALEGISEKGLPAGKSLLYKFLLLLRAEKFNLARFAYTIARIEPDRKQPEEARAAYRELREKLYTWGTSPKDREQLAAAIELIIYRMRDK